MFGSFSAGLLFVFLAITISACPTVGKADFVGDVVQNYREKLNSLLDQQIFGFSESMVFYKAYASYFDRADVNLPGFTKFFLSLADERTEAAHNMTAIVNERGGYVNFKIVKLRKLRKALSDELARFPHVLSFVLGRTTKQDKKKKKPRKPQKPYKEVMTSRRQQNSTPKMPTALSALEDSLALEKLTNKQLIDLMAAAVEWKDPAMRVKLDDFLERQVDVIFKLSNLVTRLDLYKDDYPLGEYILDSDLTY